MPAVLAVDLGKTSCRAALWLDEGAAGRRATEAGAPGLAFRDGIELAERAVAGVWRQLCEDLDPPTELAVCIGAAGAMAAPEAARTLAGRLSALFPTGMIATCSDAVIAHAGALDGRPGLVLVAGTGSVVIGIGPDSATDHAELVRVDGWGPLLGDLGSGGWIGAAGLRAALRVFDGRGPETDLEQAASAEFGDLADLPTRFADRHEVSRQLAAFAPTVAALAAANDQVSRQIMTDAAGHLAETVLAGQRRLSADDPDLAPELAIVGGLTELGEPLLEPLAVALAIAAPRLSITISAGDPLDGARRLALDEHTVHERHIHRSQNRSAEQVATARHRSE